MEMMHMRLSTAIYLDKCCKKYSSHLTGNKSIRMRKMNAIRLD